MKKILLGTIAASAFAMPAMAETIEVEMLNRNDAGESMVFSDELIEAEVGDIIRFVPTDRGHNAQSVDDAVPEGQEAFEGAMNEVVEYEVTEPGLTAVICRPHQAMGMVALVVAGDSLDNADEVLDARVPGRGGKKIEALMEEARGLETAS